MRGARSGLSRRLCGPCLAAVLATDPAVAQESLPLGEVVRETGVAAPSPILTVDQDRLFRDSAFGRHVLARAEEEAATLTAENRRIEAALEAEERSLTDQRRALSAEDFSPLAAAFDAKVEEIRTAQDAKSRDITRRLEDDRQRFVAAMYEVLGQVMRERGAVAVVPDSAIIVSLSSLDATDDAIARMDQTFPAPP